MKQTDPEVTRKIQLPFMHEDARGVWDSVFLLSACILQLGWIPLLYIWRTFGAFRLDRLGQNGNWYGKWLMAPGIQRFGRV
jgi:hypothetical protein